MPAESPLDILADELGAVAGRIERELRQGFEALTARVDARLVAIELAALKSENERQERFTARLAELRDGRDGKDGRDGLDGKDGLPGRDGVDGRDGERGTDGAPGRDGVDGRDGEKGLDGVPGRNGRDGIDGINGEPGEKGDRGEAGQPGKLPIVREWAARVHYEGDVVRHNGSTYQAAQDTGGEPPGGDWLLLAGRGADGIGFTLRRTFDANEQYHQHDIVMCGGSSFVALKDDPGSCPGEGWQLWASAGKRGKEGQPGRVTKGDAGSNGASIVSARIEGMELILIDSDGDQFRADLSPIAEQILAAAQ